jgi:hypothetical protein
MVLRFRVQESSLIEAPADLVYNLIADYKQHHGNIIPPAMFGGMKVVKGSGVGNGTRIACTFRILGKEDTLIMDVSELKGGNGERIIQEIDSKARNITQFIVEEESSDTCKVTICTDVMRQEGWIAGAIDQFVCTAIMKSWYKKELVQLNEYAQTLQRDGKE